MNRRFGTAPANGTADTKRLAQWLVLVGFLALLAYGSRIDAGKPDPEVLYRWSTAAGGVIQDAIVVALVLVIARGARPLLGLRGPKSFWMSVVFVAAAVVLVILFEAVYSNLVHPGNEQGLTPDKWQPSHAAAYAANGAIVCTLVPFVEELTFRGLGFDLLRPYGKWAAIVGTGVLFGLSHGLLLSLPIIVAFGCALAWIRSRTDSVYPGMVLHALFNAIALVAAVTIGS